MLVPRALRFELTERIRHDGRVEQALDEDEVRAVVRRLKTAGVRSVAVCFLYCDVNPQHEERVPGADHARRRPVALGLLNVVPGRVKTFDQPALPIDDVTLRAGLSAARRA